MQDDVIYFYYCFHYQNASVQISSAFFIKTSLGLQNVNMKGKTKWLQVFNMNKLYLLQEIILIFFVCSKPYTVNSLVSDHPWCMGGGRLRENQEKELKLN